jgi:hypothetical protein
MQGEYYRHDLAVLQSRHLALEFEDGLNQDKLETSAVTIAHAAAMREQKAVVDELRTVSPDLAERLDRVLSGPLSKRFGDKMAKRNGK